MPCAGQFEIFKNNLRLVRSRIGRVLFR